MEKRRDYKRIPVYLEAEFEQKNDRYFAVIENISESGIYMKISCVEYSCESPVPIMVNVKLSLPSGKILHLICKKVWSNRNAPNSLIQHIGVEIPDPPEAYVVFCQFMRLSSVNSIL